MKLYAKENTYFAKGTEVTKIMHVITVGDTSSSLYRGVRINQGENSQYPVGSAYETEEICNDIDFDIVNGH